MSEKVEKARKRAVLTFQFLEGAKDGAIISLAAGAVLLVALKVVKQIVK